MDIALLHKSVIMIMQTMLPNDFSFTQFVLNSFLDDIIRYRVFCCPIRENTEQSED